MIFIDIIRNQGKLPVMIGNLMKLKKPDSPNKEMEFGREEVTPNRLKQLNKMKARRPMKDMKVGVPC